MLLLISSCKKKLRQKIIEGSDKDFIYAILECVFNVVNGNVRLDNKNFEKLKQFKTVFKHLLNKNLALKQKKKILIQKGGFLQFLIPAIITGISSIISAAISKND
jgi:hypothetical protein